MAVEALTAHPSFRQLRRRVRTRTLLQWLRRGIVVALAGAAMVVLVGRMADLHDWWIAAVGWVGLCVIGALAMAMARAPDTWMVAREADALGLAERITSSMYAHSVSSDVAQLVAGDAAQALASLDPTRYSVSENRRVWRAAAAGLAVLALLAVVPLPSLGSRADMAQQQRIATAQQQVQSIELQLPKDTDRPTDLNERTAQELKALRDALARSTSSAEAAKAIEQSQQHLSQLAGADDYVWRRSLDMVANALEAQSDQMLTPLAQALRARDGTAVGQALADLSARLDQPGGVSDTERENIQRGLQSAANAAAASQPRLASALRRAASAVGSKQGAPLSDRDLPDLLDQGVADAAALANLEQAMGELGQLRATTLPPGATLVPASGTPTAYVLVRGTPGPNVTPVGVALGAGYSNSGASPEGTTAYDPVFAPTHLGAEPGPTLGIPGDASGARGAGVDLPRGPVSASDVRPYDQVYAEYAQEARQSASRQQLPANVQVLVDRYFGAIAPTPGAAVP